MTKIDIISGFLGAGKTTLIKKLLNDALKGEQVVLIENEFGEIGIDGGFLKEAGVQITEMNSGCICCSLVGDFATALKEVIEKYHPDRILIEPSGVGKLSDVIRAVSGIQSDVPVELNSFVTVVDAGKAKIYIKNFGEFFNNQVESANTIILSRTQGMSQEKLEACVALLREHNAKAAIVTTPWDELTGAQMKAAMEQGHSLAEELLAEMEEEEEHEHHHHHHDGEDECGCGHHHHHDDDDDDDEEHEHHHHDDECGCGHDHDHEEHEHHHHDHDDEDEECSCGCGHHHHHHGHHHADEVFTSWGQETPHVYTKEDLEQILEKLSESSAYGVVLRAKGIVPSTNGWLQFDLTPGEYEIREGAADYTGRLCVIGSELKEDELLKLFQLA
ncbi:MAG: GTP-binding protein [Lachnospiraceae bacterium]|nr:GTP-binding protein [Lachnospiraceae bacterium]